MILSRLRPDPRSREARRDLGNPFEMHRTLWSAYPDGLASTDERILWRLDTRQDGGPEVLVQSRLAPDWSRLTARFPGYLSAPAESKSVSYSLYVGQRLRFRLRANASVKREGKRRAIVGPEAQLDWLQRQLERHGMRLIRTDVVDEGSRPFRKGAHEVKISVARYEGELQVEDPTRSIAAIESGIGHGKGLGLGLLSIAAA